MNIAIKREQSGTCTGSAEREQFGTKFKKITTDFLRTAGLSLAAATVALCGMTACTNDDNITADEPAIVQPAAVKTYQVSIPATMGGEATTRAVSFDGTTSTSTFASTEKVYVYNASTDEVMGGYLQPTNISADGKSCNLTGTLSGGTISGGNTLRLFYNLSNVETNKEDNMYKCYTYFEYDGQGGTQAGVLDGAEATVTVSSYTGDVLTTTATASFTNLQSMFRFQFVDENGTAINVKSLRIQSYKSALVTEYYPLKAGNLQNPCADYVVNLGTATTGYIYVALRINESSSSDDVLTFTATDVDGNEYQGTKSAPGGGFVNGKYYYNSTAITLTKQAARIAPTITWTNPSTPITPDEYYRYLIPNSISNSDITISGTSKGYRFRLEQNGIIRLNNLTATYDGENPFIEFFGSLTLDVNGTNTITCKNWSKVILVDGTLKLSGSGTLTVTVKNYEPDLYGIRAEANYYNYKYDSTNNVNLPANNSNASVLAAPGHTVTRSARTDNADGTYTWTYTVAPTE